MTETSTIDFSILKLPVHDNIYSHNIENQKHIYDYLSQLDEQQKKAYVIAYNHLGSSFNICKSNGFKSWKTENGKK
jgi:hypothetical protein